ncbi:MAG TPA: DUF5985 family protein [Candidatus Elarobacter sp.]|jgi:hypothetical protein|nr:DUF5985 family protein [Candidatus Elarobacter sp.]
MLIAEIVYALCAITSGMCAVLLWRGYLRTRHRFLLWCALGFAGLLVNNVMLFADKVIFVAVDLSTARLIPAVFGLGVLCYGLIWDADR